MKRVLLGVTVLAMLGASPQVSATEPVRWKKGDGGNNHYYDVVSMPNRITWEEAQLDAEAQGGYLATLTSPEENAFVFPLLRDLALWRVITGAPRYRSAGPWIGGYQDPGWGEPYGGWSWITGEPVQFSYGWLADEPNEFYSNRPNEDRMQFFYNSLERPLSDGDEIFLFTPGWNDSDGAAPHVVSYVIEWDKNPKRYKNKGR